MEVAYSKSTRQKDLRHAKSLIFLALTGFQTLSRLACYKKPVVDDKNRLAPWRRLTVGVPSYLFYGKKRNPRQAVPNRHTGVQRRTIVTSHLPSSPPKPTATIEPPEYNPDKFYV
jgi:hypothetical protein